MSKSENFNKYFPKPSVNQTELFINEIRGYSYRDYCMLGPDSMYKEDDELTELERTERLDFLLTVHFTIEYIVKAIRMVYDDNPGYMGYSRLRADADVDKIWEWLENNVPKSYARETAFYDTAVRETICWCIKKFAIQNCESLENAHV